MLESEWLSSADPKRMLAWITCAGPSGDGERDLERWRKRPSDRKLRAWIEACRGFVAPEPSIWENGLGTPAEVQRALHDWGRENGFETVWSLAQRAALLRDLVGNPWRPVSVEVSPGAWLVSSVRGTGELTYRQRVNPNVLAIARRAYDEGDFAALPVLADALEDAGCDSEDLLRHLRGQERCWSCQGSGQHFTASGPCNETGWIPLRGPHVRGCWALDTTILGKDGAP